MARLKKRGIYLTLITLMILSLILLFFNFNSKLSLTDEDKMKKDRIQQINSIISDINIDSERALYISGYRTIIGMTEYIREYQQGVFDSVDDVTDAFKEIMITGKKGTTPLDSMKQEGSEFVTLGQWKSNMIEKLGSLNIDLLFDPAVIDPADIVITQESPFELNIAWTTTMTLADRNDPSLKWELKGQKIETVIPIEGFEDPLYIIGSNGKYSNIINKSEYSTFKDSIGGLMDVELRKHIQNQRYFASTASPSFIQRFLKKGIGGYDYSNTNGIESFVFIPSLYDSDRRSDMALDAVYWGYISGTGDKIVNGLSYDCWFFINDAIAVRYDIPSSVLAPPPVCNP